MAFSDKKHKKLSDVLKHYTIQYEKISETPNVEKVNISPYFMESIQFTLDNIAYKVSEEMICESIIYPILLEVWKPYVQYFSFWSHTALNYDDELKGIPDFLITKRSSLGHIILEQPYVAVVEAKLDDFVGGWAQCTLEMLAIQKMNNETEKPIYGIVSNGDVWQFAKLQKNVFYEYETILTLRPLSTLFGVLTYVLEECKRIYIDGEN